MRWLLGTLAASSQHAARHRPPALFGDSRPQLAIEEYRALAGVWRADLELDDGVTSISLHLADPHSQQTVAPARVLVGEDASMGSQGSELTDDFPSHGAVRPLEEAMPYDMWMSMCRDEKAWTSARWSVSRDVFAGQPGDDVLGISVHLGNLYLEGRGQRRMRNDEQTGHGGIMGSFGAPQRRWRRCEKSRFRHGTA